jgi:hypothetical protein
MKLAGVIEGGPKMLPRDIVRQHFHATDKDGDSQVQFDEIYPKILEMAGDIVPVSKNQNLHTFG